MLKDKEAGGAKKVKLQKLGASLGESTEPISEEQAKELKEMTNEMDKLQRAIESQKKVVELCE